MWEKTVIGVVDVPTIANDQEMNMQSSRLLYPLTVRQAAGNYIDIALSGDHDV